MEVTVSAPGGKLDATRVVHMMIASRKRVGVERTTAGWKSRKGLPRTLKSSSMMATR